MIRQKLHDTIKIGKQTIKIINNNPLRRHGLCYICKKTKLIRILCSVGIDNTKKEYICISCVKKWSDKNGTKQ